MSLQRVKYKSDNHDFYNSLKERVDHYFKTNHLSRNGNPRMWIKTVVMLAIYFVPFFMILTGLYLNTAMFLGLWVVMGIGLAGIGLSVMHDANHGSYSKNKTVNNILGKSLNLVGGFDLTWKIQHNVLHHTYTNIEGLDEDIAPGPFLRFSPHKPKIAMHRFQHFYFWFLYGLVTLSWVVQKDFTRLAKYEKNGLLKGQKTTYAKAMFSLIAYKIFYLFYILFVPIVILGMSWSLVLAGFFMMHFVGGVILSLVFQPAHVMESSEYPVHQNHEIQNSWAEQQMQNTTNFAMNSKWFTWYVGGLNYQIEHHLFPNMCHVHYSHISKIVQETAKEHHLPYHSQRTFADAVHYHSKMLKQLGA